jgi:hypothetical protein
MDSIKIIKNKNVKRILFVLMTMILIYIVFILVSLSPGVNSNVHFEDKMYYTKNVNDAITTIKITTYITNEGISDSGEIRIKMFVKDNKGISQSETEKDIGSISSHKTKEVVLDINVKESESYYVDALLFEDDERIVSSQGKFTAPTPSEPNQTTGGDFSPDEERAKSSKSKLGAPGFEGVFFIAVLIAMVMTIRKKRLLFNNRR